LFSEIALSKIFSRLTPWILQMDARYNRMTNQNATI